MPRAGQDAAVPMTVESVRPWWCAANAVHVFSIPCSVFHRMLDCCANQRYQLVCVFFFFFLLVTGKSPEEKAQLIFISTPPNIPHSSSLLYSYYSVLSLYLSISPSSVLGGWFVLSCLVFVFALYSSWSLSICPYSFCLIPCDFVLFW